MPKGRAVTMSTTRQTPARITMTVIGLVLLTALGLTLVYATQRVLVWMVVAVFFAIVLTPPVNWLERRVRWIPRWMATLLTFLIVILIIAGLITVFAIPLAKEISELARAIPDLVRDTQAGRGPVGGLIARFHVRDYLATHQSQISQQLTKIGAPTLAFLLGAATTVVGAVTIFVLSYVMVLEGPRIIDGALLVFNPERAERIRRVGEECTRTVTGYLTGNLLISLICGALTYLVLKIFNVPYAGLIALFAALMDLIPMVGATLGAVVAILAAFSESLVAGIVVAAFFVAYQQIENHLLQPIIFARTVRLSPLTVLVAVLISVELAGILGSLLAIPVAGMIKVIGTDLWQSRFGLPPRPPEPIGDDPAPATA